MGYDSNSLQYTKPKLVKHQQLREVTLNSTGGGHGNDNNNGNKGKKHGNNPNHP